MGTISLIILKSLGVIGNTTLLEFKPFWFTHSMIESIDKFYWPRLASYRYNQTSFIMTIIIEVFLIFLFFIGNLGVRILGIGKLFYIFIKNKTKDTDILFISFLLISFIFPLLFVQKGTAWNTIQFFYYFLFITNFYLAKGLSQTYKKYKLVYLFLLIFVSVGSIGTLKDYFGNPPPSSLPINEIKALDFLKNQPPGFVLTYPYDKHLKNDLNTPIPLYAYETTAYVSAFSQKPVFLEDEMNLDITGFDWQTRRQEAIKFFSSSDKYYSRGFLINNDIQYIYLVNNQKINLGLDDLQIDKIYDFGNVEIFNVQK